MLKGKEILAKVVCRNKLRYTKVSYVILLDVNLLDRDILFGRSKNEAH